MTRQEHMDWCKRRAIEYIDAGDTSQAFASMMSDLNKHEETKDHAGMQLGLMLLMTGNLSTPTEMREFIEGFH